MIRRLWSRLRDWWNHAAQPTNPMDPDDYWDNWHDTTW